MSAPVSEPGGADHSPDIAAAVAERMGNALRSGDLAEDVTGGARAEDYGCDGTEAWIELDNGTIYVLAVRRIH